MKEAIVSILAAFLLAALIFLTINPIINPSEAAEEVVFDTIQTDTIYLEPVN